MSPYQEEQWFMSEPISFCMNSPKNKYRWQRVYDNEDFFFIFGFSLEELKKIQPKEKGKTPYYKSIEVIKAGEKININGDLKIRDYFDKLRSSSFKAEIKFSTQGKPKMLIFWGAGFGHGMGMCQDGACSMGQEGHSYREILRHYYPAMKLKKAY
jgi:SpoIID/LytB domain protein